jgi:Ig-like domain CHU_C associated
MKVLAIVKNIPPNVFLNAKFLNHYLKSSFLFLILIQICYYNSYSRTDDLVVDFNHRSVKDLSHFKSINLINQNLIRTASKVSNRFKKEDNFVLNQLIINTTLKTSYCTGETSLIVCQANGVYNANNVFSVALSDSSGSFTTSTIIGTLTSSATGSSSINFKIPTNIPVSSSYRVRLMASSPVTISSDNGFNISVTTIPAPTATASQAICNGQSAVLSASCIAGTVKWYDAEVGGNAISNTTVSPTITTDYFASCEQGVTCKSARTMHTVIVKTFDNVAIPPSASSCLNSDVELSVITEDTDLTYAWTGPNGFTSTLQSPTITNLTSAKVGIYTVSITNLNSCSTIGTTSVSIGQSLQSLNVTGDVAVCFNGTINLTAVTFANSGMSYTWSGPNSFSATGQTISRVIFTANGNGTTTYHDGEYTVVASNSTTGCTGTTSVSVAVGNPINVPSSLPAGSACEGTPYTLDWAIGGANFRSYTWSGPSGFTSSSTAVCDSSFNCNHATAIIPNFLPGNSGLYTINAIFTDNFKNFCQVTTTKRVTVKYNPDISISSNSAVCLGDALNFYATYTNATAGISSYSWTGPNNFSSTLQNPVLYTTSLAGIGIYRLTAVGVNSCVGTATTYANIIQAIPPVIEPTTSVVLGNSITLTANGCDGTLLWYKSSDNQSVIMPVSPTVATDYYAKCNLGGCVSGKSGDISVSIKPPIAISVKTGNWEDATTWDIARVPLPIDSVIIRPNHIITINSLCYAKWLAWTGFGNLVFKSSASKLNLFGNPITPPPVITSNPKNVIEGTSVTFSATATGRIIWYKNGVNLNISDTSFTVSQPLKGDIYTAKASIDGIVSVMSNAITVVAKPAPVIAPPVITSNPTNVTAGNSVTFTAVATGTISWYKNGVSLNSSVLNYTESQPVEGDIYTAKATIDSIIWEQLYGIKMMYI